MDLFTAIHRRRSVRQFTPEPVSPEAIETLLRAAMAAPSAGNAQPWRFLVVTGANALHAVAQTSSSAVIAARAPLSILVCAETVAKKHGLWALGCAAAVQNMLLAATGLGLGAVWTAVYPAPDRMEAFLEILELPAKIIPFALVVCGHPTDAPTPQGRFDPGKVYMNSWGTPFRSGSSFEPSR